MEIARRAAPRAARRVAEGRGTAAHGGWSEGEALCVGDGTAVRPQRRFRFSAVTGYTKEFPVERLLPGYAKITEIYEGTSEIQRSSDVDRVSFSLAPTGLAPHFDGRLYTSQMVKRGKPAPDLFLYAAERMQADPGRTLVIEDSISGVTAGKAAGMTVWGFVGGSHIHRVTARPSLTKLAPIRVFGRMADFWRTSQ